MSAVVVTCHEAYRHWLPGAITAIDLQALPFDQKILVLDRCSGPSPEFDGWEIIRTEAGNPNVARNAGLARVTEPWVVFWDADNVMPKFYLTNVHLDVGRNVAFLYPHIRYRDEMGVEVKFFEVPEWDYWLFREKTFVDTASLWRVSALRSVGGWSPLQTNHDDFELSLRLSRAGWIGQKSGAVTNITEHKDRRSRKAHDVWNAYTLAVVTLWGGLSKAMDEVLAYYATAEFPLHTRLYWVDNTGNPVASAKLARSASAAKLKFESVTLVQAGKSYVVAEGEKYLTWKRHQHVANLYNEILPRIDEDLVLFIEDDNIPPRDGLKKLHDQIRPWYKIAAAGGIYRSRNYPEYCCAALDLNAWLGVPRFSDVPAEPIRVGMMGGGFTLYANWALKRALPMECTLAPNGNLTGWDGNLGMALTANGYELRLHGGVKVAHECAEVQAWEVANL